MSSAVVKAIAEQTIKWSDSQFFGYEVADEVPGVDDAELLHPRKLYQREGRMDEYETFVDRFKEERTETLRRYPDLDEDIIRAVV